MGSRFVLDLLKPSFDTENILQRLKDIVSGEVYDDDLSRLLWSTDASMYQVLPSVIVIPKNVDDVINTVKFCWKYNIPIHPRGAGSGLGGASIGEGIVIDFTKYMNNILGINSNSKNFTVQPGCRLSNIQKKLVEYNLYLPPDPSSADYCTIGGNIGTNAGGAHSVKYGLMSDYTSSLTVVLTNGELIKTGPYRLDDPYYIELKSKDTLEAKIYREIEFICLNHTDIIQSGYPEVNYNVTGYELREVISDNYIDLTRVFIGSEGSLGTIIEISMRAVPIPIHNRLMVAYFDNVEKMGKATWEALQEEPAAVEVLGIELLDMAIQANPQLREKIPDNLQYLIMIEFDGNDLEAIKTQINGVITRITQNNDYAFYTEIASNEEDKEKLWEIRKTGLPLLGKINDNGRKSVPVIEDAAVPPENLPEYLIELYRIMEKTKIKLAI